MEERISRHKSALQELARSDFADFSGLIHKLTETTAQALQVARVSVWFFNKEQTQLVCSDLFQGKENSHERDMRLEQADYPDYFKAIRNHRILAVSTALDDPHTREFTDHYLEPLGIMSMLDAAIFSRSRLAGLLCCEHIGPARDWAAEEQTFINSLTDIVALALEVRERQQAEEELREHKANLEQTIKERTADLEFEIDMRKKTGKELLSYMAELERFQAMAVDREQMMIRLKEELNTLLVQHGQEARYTIVK
jgi:GAF domain-containing protein